MSRVPIFGLVVANHNKKLNAARGQSGRENAFFYAGSGALLVSHWPVQSDAAVALTTRTLGTLRGCW
jgi:hypothetical protein